MKKFYTRKHNSRPDRESITQDSICSHKTTIPVSLKVNMEGKYIKSLTQVWWLMKVLYQSQEKLLPTDAGVKAVSCCLLQEPRAFTICRFWHFNYHWEYFVFVCCQTSVSAVKMNGWFHVLHSTWCKKALSSLHLIICISVWK